MLQGAARYHQVAHWAQGIQELQTLLKLAMTNGDHGAQLDCATSGPARTPMSHFWQEIDGCLNRLQFVHPQDVGDLIALGSHVCLIMAHFCPTKSLCMDHVAEVLAFQEG